MKVEYTRLLRFAQEDTPPERDYRLHHIIVYFIHNQAPKKIVERTLLLQFADRNLGFDERYESYESLFYFILFLQTAKHLSKKQVLKMTVL